MAPKRSLGNDVRDGRVAHLIAKEVENRRRLAGLTQRALAERSGIPIGTLRRIESAKESPTRHGLGTQVSYQCACALAKALNCTPSEIGIDAGTNALSVREKDSVHRLTKSAGVVAEWAREISGVLSSEHVHAQIIASIWTRRVASVRVRRMPPKVESWVAATLWAPMLHRLSDHERVGIRAIVDLSDQAQELLQDGNSRPAEAWVGERMFVIPFSAFKSRGAVESAIGVAARHAKVRHSQYSVRLGVTQGAGDVPSHPLGPNVVGMQLMLLPPDTCCAYCRDPHSGEVHLACVTGDHEYMDAQKYFSLVRRMSIAVEPTMSERECLAGLYNVMDAGTFENEWASHDDRPLRYFDLYDANIVAWIPWYFELNELAARAVRREVMGRLRRGRESHICEFGYGTGGATDAVVQWATSANEIVASADAGQQCVSAYSGLDAARSMYERMSVKLKGRSLCRFVHGTFGADALRRATGGRQIDVLFGTLVLHDIIGGEHRGNLARFFRVAREHMAVGGTVVLGDVFMSSNKEQRTKEVATWRAGMMRRGLSESQADKFLAANPEMTATIDEEGIATEGAKLGFILDRVVPVTKADVGDIPFKVLVLRRKE